jgi:hypothetical protein
MLVSGTLKVFVQKIAPAMFVMYSNDLKPGHSVLAALGFRVLGKVTIYFIM